MTRFEAITKSHKALAQALGSFNNNCHVCPVSKLLSNGDYGKYPYPCNCEDNLIKWLKEEDK